VPGPSNLRIRWPRGRGSSSLPSRTAVLRHATRLPSCVLDHRTVELSARCLLLLQCPADLATTLARLSDGDRLDTIKDEPRIAREQLLDRIAMDLRRLVQEQDTAMPEGSRIYLERQTPQLGIGSGRLVGTCPEVLTRVVFGPH
jgi:hypothetical protein